MKTLLVTSPQPGAGKTGVIAALALRLAYEGQRVLALRLGSPQDTGAVADAEYYATLPFARGRGGSPMSVPEALQTAETSSRPVDLLFLEDAGDGSGAALAGNPDVRILVVLRGDPREQADLLRGTAEQLGSQFAGVVATAVPERRVDAVRAAAADLGVPVIVTLPEDRTLHAPSVGDLVEALDAEVILGDPDMDEVVEYLAIGPLTVDPADPYFKRRRHKAVLTRSDKTDLQLAALHTQTDLLILTGGFPPSPYAIDRAAGEEVPILLTQADTREAMRRLSNVHGVARFRGEQRLERMGELLAAQLDVNEMRRLVAAE